MLKIALINLTVLFYLQTAYGALMELPKTPLFLSGDAICEASLSPAAQNTNLLNENTSIFLANFSSPSWHGNLYAYGISAEGNIYSTPRWNAGCKLTGGVCAKPAQTASENTGKIPSDRVIITRAWDGTNKGIPFRWPERYQEIVGTSPNLAALLAQAPYAFNTSVEAEINSNQRYGEALLNYLRGERSYEKQNSNTYLFRDRVSILGDIVHSNVTFVQSHSYTDDIEIAPYSAFKQTNATRIPMVAVGANDGMLHIFNANNGEELLAFVPGNHQIYQKLPLLSHENYSHEYFVDGGITANDVFINGQWRTILVGGYRNGAQGIYALDITTPASFSEENADSIYLWEFSDKDDSDIGYIYGPPIIAKVNSSSGSSKWAVIFGNGYNSVSGKTYLFVLFIESGLDGEWVLDQDYIKVAVEGGNSASPNGLASTYPIVINDGSADTPTKYVLDYIYAGDLLGNLWRFDVRASPTQWVPYSLFSSSGQPITSAPVVGPHLGGKEGVMVYFGTGKYLEEADAPSNPPPQSFYGLWDRLDTQKIEKENLLEQKIIEDTMFEIDYDEDGVIDAEVMARFTSNDPIDWSTHQGWLIDLTLGERVITNPTLQNGIISFTTSIPSALPCGEGRSWLMELNANNGGRLPASPFDFNKDGVLSAADYLYAPTLEQVIPVSGIQFDTMIVGTPLTFTSADGAKIKVLNGIGGINSVKVFPSASGATGRQSWKQL